MALEEKKKKKGGNKKSISFEDQAKKAAPSSANKNKNKQAAKKKLSMSKGMKTSLEIKGLSWMNNSFLKEKLFTRDGNSLIYSLIHALLPRTLIILLPSVSNASSS